MFSQVTKTSAIREHAIYWETIGDFESFTFLQGLNFLLLEEDFDFRRVAFRS
jgi:hypothetical protein